MIRRLKLLIILAGLGGALTACAPEPEDITPTESATSFPNIPAQKNYVWQYYTGLLNGAGSPAMLMYQPDINCSPQYQGNGLYAYRIGKTLGACNADTGEQTNIAPFNFYATYEIWQNHTPNLQQKWYATLAVNFLCMAAYQRAGFSYQAAFPYCDGSASSTVPTVRRAVFDVFYPGDLFWR